ncbi:MAG TPA: T6SS immunity protein Tdi1 domain-containing protein [Blastocatellia bacterium]|nr:T6SS immunity protein Tdi1 domain-containing protein [Blastocatellia bacterium]
MALKLTWDDLLIQNFPKDKAASWISEWAPLISGTFYPVFMSKFGDWFLRRPDGTIELLDVLEGTLQTIARTESEFVARVNNVQWQEEYLLSWLVYQLHEDGKIPAEGECYGFAPHPTFGGQLNRQNVMVLEIGVWQSICSQTFYPRQ